MEQLRVVLEKLKKYHFWILCGLIVLITFGVWFTATSDRADAFTKQKSKDEKAFSDTSQISSKQDQANQNYDTAIQIRNTGILDGASEEAKAMSKITSGSQSLSANVSIANERLFDDQRSANPLPVIYADAPTQRDFEAAFRKVWNHRIEQIEDNEKKPADQKRDEFTLLPQFRDRYRDRIKDEVFPQLFKLVELRNQLDNNGVPMPGSGPMGPGGAEDKNAKYSGVVTWPAAEQLKDWFHNWVDRPSTLQVMIAQEDLWVYEALLRIIRNTNNIDPKHDPKNYQSPGGPGRARIKAIEALDIGNNAAQSWSASENAVFNFSDAAAGNKGPSGGLGSRGGFMNGVGGSSGVSLLANRYVDAAGKLLDAPDPNQEFRMMPIDMKVIIEQKDIPRLLVECANSSMRVDVRAVRILAEKPGAFDGNGNGATDAPPATPSQTPSTPSPGMRSPGRGGFRNPGTMLGSPTASQPSSAPSEGALYTYAGECADSVCPPVPVEIQGVVYIYNPPTTQAAGQGQQPPGGPAGAGSVAPAAMPGATTPPAAGGGVQH